MKAVQQPTSRDYAELALFPLPNVVLFPTMQLPLHVFELRYRRLIQDALDTNRLVGVPRLKPGFDSEYHGQAPFFDIFGVGKIVDHHSLAGGRSNVLLLGLNRVRFLEELPSKEYRVARVEPIFDQTDSSPAVLNALQTELHRLARRIIPASTKAGTVLERLLQDAPDAGSFVDTVVSLLIEDPEQRQQLLEESDPGQRMLIATQHLHELAAAGDSSGTGPTLN